MQLMENILHQLSELYEEEFNMDLPINGGDFVDAFRQLRPLILQASKSKHTSGPWYAEDEFNGNFYYVMGDGGIIAEASGDANARLIAAAPDLLEALKLALATIERMAVQYGPFSSTSGTQDVGRAAIRKATGGSE
jgi:hypothetical protein